VIVANLIPTNNIYVLSILEFVNANLLIIILFVILFFLGEIFHLFNFPLNLPGPIFYAYGGYFLASFIFGIFYLIDDLTGREILSIFRYAEATILILVFMLILIFGMLNILVKRNKKTESEKEPKKDATWNDIGGEFKQGLHNIALKFRQSTEPKEEKLKKKKNKD
jgi:membrane-bound ClpP family serine protease